MMIRCGLTDFAEVMDIMESHYGENNEYITGMHKALLDRNQIVLMSDSKKSLLVFLHLYEGKYHMHQVSMVGGKDHTQLLRDGLQYVFEEDLVQVLIGFVPKVDRHIRLLIGMNSKVRPVSETTDEWVYVLTKDDIGKVIRWR